MSKFWRSWKSLLGKSLGLKGKPYRIPNSRRIFGSASEYWAIQIGWPETLNEKDGQIEGAEEIILLTEHELEIARERSHANWEDVEEFLRHFEWEDFRDMLLGAPRLIKNDRRLFGSASQYWAIQIEWPQTYSEDRVENEEEVLLLTKKDLEKVRRRAAKNPEDLIIFRKQHIIKDAID